MYFNKILTALDESQAKLQKLQEEAAMLKKEKVNISHILGDMSQSC